MAHASARRAERLGKRRVGCFSCFLQQLISQGLSFRRGTLGFARHGTRKNSGAARCCFAVSRCLLV